MLFFDKEMQSCMLRESNIYARKLKEWEEKRNAWTFSTLGNFLLFVAFTFTTLTQNKS